MATNYSTPLVSAIEQAWTDMQAKHTDLPDVVVTLGSGLEAGQRGVKLGHFAANVWARGDDITNEVHELFIGGEGLMLGAEHLMGVLLHEGTHALAEARKIKDCSQNGRYHNGKFADLAREMGLDVEKHASLGWQNTSITKETAEAYEGTIFALDLAITTYRAGAMLVAEPEAGASPIAPKRTPRGGGRASNNNGVVLTCNCDRLQSEGFKARKIRVSQSVAAAGAIHCTVCDEDFS